MIHVCPWHRVEEIVRATGATRVVSLLGDPADARRPAGLPPENHLILHFHDIVEPRDGYVLAAKEHIGRLLDFAAAWDRRQPMVVHCFAGISRSPAAAYAIAAALAPQRDEAELARQLRTLSPSATPNIRLVALADAALGRQGRMTAAIRSIGRGADAFEGEPFVLPVG